MVCEMDKKNCIFAAIQNYTIELHSQNGLYGLFIAQSSDMHVPCNQ